MDDAEIERLRKAIRYTYAGSPHKKKTYLALLDMQVEAERKRALAGGPAAAPEAPARSREPLGPRPRR